MKAAAALVVITGCGAHHWIDYACERSTAPHHDAIAFVADRDSHLELRRDDGVHRLDPPACTGDGKHIRGIVALGDGWRALVWGYKVEGGSLFESGSIQDQFTCIVDFRTGSTDEVDASLLAHDLRHFVPTIGARTGWIYDHHGDGAITVIDLDQHRAVPLPPPVPDAVTTDTAIVELDGTIRTVTGQLGPTNTGTLVVRDYDSSQWPPAPGEPRTIAVHGRTDSITLSADGRWAAYHGGDNVSEGQVAYVGVVDVHAGTIAFEKLRVPGAVAVQDVVVDGDRAWLLVTTDPYLGTHVTTARWIDSTGAYGAASRHVADDLGVTLTWLPARRAVAAEVGCDVDLLDLPPPVK